jgi:hypothetical protein
MSTYTPPVDAKRIISTVVSGQRERGFYRSYVLLRWTHWDAPSAQVLRHFTRLTFKSAGEAADRYARKIDPDVWGKLR